MGKHNNNLPHANNALAKPQEAALQIQPTPSAALDAAFQVVLSMRVAPDTVERDTCRANSWGR